MYGRDGDGFMERGRDGFMERERDGFMERERDVFMERERGGFMERERGGFMERERGGFMERGRDGGPGFDSHDYGGDSYRRPPEPWVAPYDEPDRGSSFFDQPKRGRLDYSEPERGYSGPPQHAPSWGRGDPRGRFRGNFGPTRPAGRARPLNQPPNPEMDQFRQLRPFVKFFFYGGGLKLKRENNWTPVKGVQNKGAQNKMSKGGQPPDKKTKAENSGNAEELAQSTMSDGEEDGTQEEIEHAPSSSIKPQEPESQKEIVVDHNQLNRIQFFCNLCKFCTFFEEDWNAHLKDSFHLRHVLYVKKRLPDKLSGSLEAYMESYFQRSKQWREQIDYSTKINQIYRNQDLTLELGMEHFVKKVEVAHCDACDQFLPMNLGILQEHIKSFSHKDNCQAMMLKSKQTALNMMRGKNYKRILEQYTNGKNPITGDAEKKMRSGCSKDLAPEAKESGEMAFITLSDSEGEEEGSFQGKNPFINDAEATRSNCSTELVPESKESQQMPCSTLPDSEKGEEEENSAGQVTEQEKCL